MKTKRCSRCLEVKPVTKFRKNASQEDGLDVYCKDCASELIKSHYVPFTTKEFYERGPQGALCPLWAKECGVCVDWQECWRIKDIPPDSDQFPIPKRSTKKHKRGKKLRKGRIDADDFMRSS